MGLFKRRPNQGTTRPFKSDLVASMERFGRSEYYRNEDTSWVYPTLFAPLYPLAQADPGEFLALLRNEVVPHGGWAAYGAGHLVWELLGSGIRTQLADPGDFDAVMDACIAFLRHNGVPPSRVTGYEWDHWLEHGGNLSTWLPVNPTPALHEIAITPLQTGEVRPIARVTEEPDSNVIVVRHDETGRFVALVDARWSDEDPRRSQSDWKTADTLYDLYRDVALSLQVPAPWHDRELAPFFPLSPPRI